MRGVAIVVGLAAFSVFADGGWVASVAPDIPAFDESAIESCQPTPLTADDIVRPRPLRLTSRSGSGWQRLLPEPSGDRIRELARGLDHDWRKCFRFVRDNVKFVPSPGLLRGAERTLIDREGSDADQSVLLAALLKESGVSAEVVYSPPADSGDDAPYALPLYSHGGAFPVNACSWLGVREMGTVGSVYTNVVKVLLLSGRSAYLFRNQCIDGFPLFIATDHFWVMANLPDGTSRMLDPSVKPGRIFEARDPLADAGCRRDVLLAFAGGTVSSDSVVGVSQVAVDAYLNVSAAALRQTWTNANVAAHSFVGGRDIVPLADETDDFMHGDVFRQPEIVSDWRDERKNSFRARVTVSFGSVECSFFLDELGSRRLWLSFASSGASYPRAVLKLDDQVVAAESSGASSPDMPFLISVALTNANTVASMSLKRSTGNVYVIPVGFPSGLKGGMRSIASAELAAARSRPLADASPEMLSRTLQLAGHEWLSQNAQLLRFANDSGDSPLHDFYDVGIAGYAGAPFLDFGNRFGCSPQVDGPDASSLFSSALEHAVLEQLMGANISAVSTMKILSTANSSRTRVYSADATNWNSVRAELTGYSASELTSIGVFLSSGGRAVLPCAGRISIGSWSGYGLVGCLSQEAQVVTKMLIGGGLHGGYCTANGVPSSAAFDGATVTARYDDGSVRPSFVADPVSIPSGAFMDSVTDLSLAAGTPLAWSRTYDSRLAVSDGPLGRGWRHAYEARISEGADPDAVFGGGSIAAVIPTALAYAVVKDLLSDINALAHGEQARRWLVAAAVVDWWTRRHTGSSAVVSDGARTVAFQKLEDGSYAPPPGVTDTLVRSNGVFVLSRRLGSSCIFDSSNRMSAIVDRFGNRTDFSYDDAGLASVVNSFGRTLSISWSDGRIRKVKDNSGRSVKYAYDAAGCLTNVHDSCGHDWRYAYGAEDARLTKAFDADGIRTVRNRYDCFGRVTNQVSAVGGSTRFGYAADVSAWSVDPLGGRLDESFDSDGHCLSRTDRTGAKTVYTYDGHGHPASKVDALGRKDLYGFDSFDRSTSIYRVAPRRCRLNSCGYDSRHRLVAETNALNGVTTITYADDDLPRARTRPDDSYETFKWNARGLCTSRKRWTAAGDIFVRDYFGYADDGLPVTLSQNGRGLPEAAQTTASFACDAVGRRVSSADANGNVTQYTYDACGRVTSVIDALAGVASNEYSRAGHLIASTDPLGRRTRYLRTSSGKVASVISPNCAFTTNVYDAADRLVRTVDERGHWTDYGYDAEGRLVSTSDLVSTNRIVRDAAGRVVATTNSVGAVETFAYDDLDHVTSRVDCAGAVWRSRSNYLGWTLAVTNPIGKVTRYAYDRVGNRILRRHPSGASERFAHDVGGNVIAFTNAEGHVTTRAFDGLGRLVSETDACGCLRFTNQYDLAGNLLSRMDGEGRSMSCSYDALNRLVFRTCEDSCESFVYDAVGNPLVASNGVAQSAFTYDARDRLVSATIAVGGSSFVVSWRHDAGGLVTNLVYGVGRFVSKAYDLRGRLVSVRDWLGHEWTFGYDAENRLVRGTSPDGVTRTLAYDGCGRVIGWSVGALAGRTIERDAAGRRIRDTVTAGPMPCAALRRRAENTFDAADRLVSASVTYSITNRPVRETFAYDRTGALTNAVRRLPSGESASFFAATYDAQGRLASLGGGADAPPVAFAYDALGNRVRTGDRLFVPDHDDPLKRPLLECDADGAVLRQYLWGPTGLLGFVDADGTLTVAHTDEQGSVIALTDIDGNVLFRATYGPHGENWGVSGSNPTPFAWLGGYGVMKVDPSANSSLIPHPSSLYLTRHRLYSPTLGRFLSADPLGLEGGGNLYAYANGNPLAYVDPLGLCAEDWDALTRIGGFFQMLGGAGEGMVGVAGFFAAGLSGNLPGVTVGLAAWAHGSDQMAAGFDALWQGERVDTQTSQALQSLGLSQESAAVIDAGMGVALTVGAGAIRQVSVSSGSVYVQAKRQTGSEMVTVSRWGREGLKSGDFVMKGDASRVNYYLSGKFQPAWMPGKNIPASFDSGVEYSVPRISLSYPRGLEILKTPLGQRIYTGPDIPPLAK